MTAHRKLALRLTLPKHWPLAVRSGMLHVISLAQFAAVYSRSWAADSVNQRVRLKTELECARQQIALLREEVRIKDARMARILPRHRPRYPPSERMAILELRAARGWSLKQAARTFHLTAATISSWLKRIDENGPQSLVQFQSPVNRFPDFVGYVVRRLKTLCPSMGKVKLAETLARAGLHLGSTTVGRMLKEPNKTIDTPPAQGLDDSPTGRIVTAKRRNHLWHIDLTVVPTGAGLWCSWLPLALPQRWPFCWWVVCAVDHLPRLSRLVSWQGHQAAALRRHRKTWFDRRNREIHSHDENDARQSASGAIPALQVPRELLAITEWYKMIFSTR